MAEVRKNKKVEKYNIDEIAVKKNTKVAPNKEEKKTKKVKKTTKKTTKVEKKSLWVRFRIFCHGVKSECSKVHWPGKNDMLRYSIATIGFIIFCALFFYLINIIFALIQTLF